MKKIFLLLVMMLTSCGAGSFDLSNLCDGGTCNVNVNVNFTATQPDSTSGTCGNGVIESGEECDDGNVDVCDGCENCNLQKSLHVPASDYVHFDDLDDVLSNSTDECYEIWAKVSNTPDHVTILSSATDSDNGHFFIQCIENTTLRIVTLNGGSSTIASSGETCADNNWHHYAGCRTTSGSDITLTLFFDGTLVATQMGNISTLSSPDNVLVGGYGSSIDGLGGYVDEVRISDSLRYTSNFTPERFHTSDAHTVALYHFNTSASTIVDSSGHSHTGTGVSTSLVDDDGFGNLYCY